MPGILPMKVIKVGTSAQSRIAQACDRCRSKKIRCDGITPCCSQCANVGFECKTSDKLSRRAFPRGYTESLEERVRALETEVKELKDLLDEKDEKIDILSRIHSSFPSSRRPSATASPTTAAEQVPVVEGQEPKDDVFRVQQSPCLLDGDNTDSFFMGASSGRAFIDTFKAKVQESGKQCSDFKTESFFAPSTKPSLPRGTSATSTTSKAPPRLVSDQMINIFFQEWAPLFPVLHRPTFLKIYTDFVTHPGDLHDQQSIAQLNLVFGIAALSAEWNKQNAADFENQWQTAIDSVSSENTLATLQCFVLAQIYCIAKADYNKLLHYKGMAVSLSHRLGLHQSQKRFSLGALTSETRKKVFWTLYTLDCFSAALLGLPRLLNEDDIYAEYPSDIDDENVSERGFQSTLPGEPTRLSSALALFRVSRIMSKVLDQNYPAASTHDLSLQSISALNDELDAWLNSLAPHLRLHFVQDKPSTHVVGSRSPLLSLAYHYIRTLIHRPAVGSTLGPKASSSVMALAGSSKHIIQIVRLLEERRMSFSFCLNKNELLLLSGFGLLFQGLDLDRNGKLIQDSQRLMCSVVEILERNKAAGAAGFKKVACAMISVERGPKGNQGSGDTTPRRKSNSVMPAPKVILKGARKQIQAVASRIAGGYPRQMKQEDPHGRRATAPSLSTNSLGIYSRSDSQNSISSAISEPSPQYNHASSSSIQRSPRQAAPCQTPNLDYLSFNNEQTPRPNSQSTMCGTPFKDIDTAYGLTQQTHTPYDGLFSSPNLLSAYISPSPSSATYDWASEIWAMPPDLGTNPASARSVLSFSEEELTSGEELSSCDMGGEYRGIVIPNVDEFGVLEGLEGSFGL